MGNNSRSFNLLVCVREYSASMCAMIGQLSGPYFTVLPAEFKSLFELESSSPA